jgi:hypothetical protein
VRKMTDEPHATGWREALDKAEAAPRCLARRRDGAECQSPAMPNGRCRMHGGLSTGPRTAEGLERSRQARWRHGHYSAQAKAERWEALASVRFLRKLLEAVQVTT